ncbi:MAG: hypothetical protein H6741_19960 [Alphaproteobacteria bacterium]|nr:hypothetical protein [Alphaproteobacteria bacterium]
MSLLFLLIAVAAPQIAASPGAPACADEPCAQIAAGLDEIDGIDVVDAGPYGWLRADLELARLSVQEGDLELAVELAEAAHYSLSAQADAVVAARGLPFLLATHRALSEVLVQAGEPAPELPRLQG